MAIEDIQDFELRQEYRRCDAVVEELGKLAKILEEARIRFPNADLPIDLTPRAVEFLVPSCQEAVRLATDRKRQIEQAPGQSPSVAAPRMRIDASVPESSEPVFPVSAARAPETAPQTAVEIIPESVLDEPVRSPVSGQPRA